MKKHTLNLEAGLLIQREQLDDWRTKLNSECYLALETRAQAHNAKLGADTSGFDVWRGTDIDQFIGNWKPQS